MFRRSCQNCNLPVQTNIWWKIGLPLKSVTVFTSFLVFRQKNVSENVRNCPARPSDLHSNRAEKHLENKTNFLEEHDFFKSFWDLEWKSFRHSTKVFSALLTKLRFASPECKFDSFFKTIFNFFINFEIWILLFL